MATSPFSFPTSVLYGGNALPGPASIPLPQIGTTPLSYGETLAGFGSSAPPSPAAPTMSTMGTAPSVPVGTGMSMTQADPSGMTAGAMAGADASGGWFSDSNLGKIQNVGEILSSFGNLYNGWQQNRLAREALDFQKKAYKTNLSNTISSYNLALEDRVRARYAQNNRSSADAESYINQHKL